MKRDRFWSYRLLGSSILCLILAGCVLFRSQPKVDNVNLLLGNPSQATANVTNTNNYLIVRPQYALSYNRDRGSSNWASWQLNQSWLGTLARIPFEPDSSLPAGWYQVNPNDYTRSGFDRGHLVPAADRNHTTADSKAVFLMTNILPQSPDNNRGLWEKLESYCRALVRQGKELYIIAGGVGTGGGGEQGRKTAIARGKVAVPAAIWKIVVVLDRPGLGLAGITDRTRVIAVVIPNRQGIEQKDWREFSTSVDQIEALTKYDFLTHVSTSIQTAIEARIDR
jgi:endonuclease G, mitochondrial